MSPWAPWRPPPPRTVPSPAASAKSAPTSPACGWSRPTAGSREITERDNPEEMQLIRSSYGLFGIVYEVTMRVRPTTALAVRHYSLSLDNFRKYFPIYKARGYAVMYYIFPYVKRVLVELRKDNPEAAAKLTLPLGLSQPLLAQIRARRHAVDPADHAQPHGAGRLPTSCTSSCCDRRSCGWCAATAPGRTPRSSTIRARRAPTNICSACGRSARGASSTSSKNIAISASPMRPRPDIAATSRASAMPSPATSSRCSPIAGRAPP